MTMRRRKRFARYTKPDQTPIVPTLTPPHGVPYSPDFQADIQDQQKYRDAPRLPGAPDARPYVLTQYDARPINCIDFQKTFTTAEQTAAAGATSALFAYSVPPGRTAVVRTVRVRAYIDQNGGAAVRNATTGAPQVSLNLDMLLNGDVMPEWADLRVDDAVSTPTFASDVDIPTYFVAPAESQITMRLTILSPAHLFAFVMPTFRGQLILSDGVNIPSEPGTKIPLPIEIVRRRARQRAV